MLRKQIVEDIKTAMKSGDTVGRDTLRMLDSMVKNEEITAGSREDGLDDAGTMAVIKRAVKQRKDSAAQYHDGGRPELAEKEEAEIAILEKYLPEQMDEAAIEKVVAAVVAEVGASSPADMGKVMGPAMKAVGDRAEGGAVRAAVQKLLS